MASSLGRMFALASAEKNAAIENFTTEALAAVVRDDPGPLLAVLQKVNVPATGPLRLAQTQVPIEDGQLDLVLDLDGLRVAIEVKVDAGPSGENQLDRYLAWVEGDAARRRLVVLSKHDIRGTAHQRAAWLPWQALRSAARSHPRWADVLLWLEERRMADDFDEPITSDEARSLGAAHALLHKSARLLLPACRHLADIWPASRWPADEQAILERAASRFARWPSFTVDSGGRFRAGLTLGIYFDEGEAWLGMWVWANPKRVDARDAIAAVAAKLDRGTWHLDPASWEVLGAYVRWADVPPGRPSRWWVERAGELEKASAFAAIEGTGQPETGEDPP